MPQKKNYDFVQFEGDGKLQGTVFSDYATYTVKDSITLTFIKTDNTEQNYMYSLKGGLLTMSP